MTELKETEKNLSKPELKLICETNFNGNYKEMLEKIEYGIKQADQLNRTETAKFLKMDLETTKEMIEEKK